MVTALRTGKPLGRTTLAPRRSWRGGARAVLVFYVWTICLNGTTLIRNIRSQLIYSRLKRRIDVELCWRNRSGNHQHAFHSL
jgi:hypothetical protein